MRSADMGLQNTAAPDSRDAVLWLLRTTSRMVRCRTVPALLELAYDAIREGLGYDRVGLTLVDRERGGLVEQIGTDEQGRKFYPRSRLLSIAPGSYHGRILAAPSMQADGEGFWYRSNALDEMPLELREHLDGAPRQNLLVALRTAEAVLGLISVDNLITGRPVTPEEAPPLVAFANALATALDNVYLLEGHVRRISDLDVNLRQRISQLEWLRETSRAITAARTLEEVLDVVYDCAREGLGFDRVGIMLFDHKRRTWEERRGTDEHGGKMAQATRTDSIAAGSDSWKNPAMSSLLRGEEYYYTNDAWSDFPPELRYLLDGHVKQCLVVPLQCGEQLTGSISVDNLLSGQPLTLDDAEPLVAVAHQVATAIENARLLEREQVEREHLALSEARLRAVLQSSPILLLSMDGRGEITLSTGNDLGLLEGDPDDLAGKCIRDAFAHRPEMLECYDLAAAGEAQTATVDLGGTSVEVHWTPQHDITGASAGVIAVAVEVTERVAAQRAAEALARLRSDFVASVSHELRTPLTAIVGYSELLQTRWASFDETQRLEHIARIVTSANRQKRIVDDLLLLSRVEQGDLRAENGRVPMAQVIARASDEVRSSYQGQQIDLRGPAELLASGDIERVVQVMVNLIDNAAKYSPEGSPIMVTWCQEGAEAVVRVRDHGPGIPLADQDQLFTRFGRVPGSRTRAGRVGTGLGLHLGRQFVYAMGGRLDLEGTGPGGSIFCLRLPVAQSGGA